MTNSPSNVYHRRVAGVAIKVDALSTEKVVNADNPLRALEIPLRISYRSSTMERRENLSLRRFGST